MFVFRVLKALREKRVSFAIAGGWAVSLHGAVRGTVDLDIVVTLSEENLSRAEQALSQIGLDPRPPLNPRDIIQFREEYIKNRNMLAWRFVNPYNPAEIVDILILEDLRNLKKTYLKVGAQKIPVITISDLIKMKKKSKRPQDLEDVKALERIQK